MFDYIGLAFVLIVLIFFAVGFARGLIRGILRLARGFLSVFLASLLSKPFGSLLGSLPFVKQWSNNLIDSFASKGGVYTQIYTESSLDLIRQQLKFPDFLKGLFESLAKFFVSDGTETVATVLGQTIMSYACMVTSFLILFAIFQIAISIVMHIVKKVQETGSAPVMIGRVLGGVLYAFLGVLFDCVICYVITIFIGFDNGFSEWIKGTMHLNDSSFALSKLLYENNVLAIIITWVQGWFVH